MEDMEEFLRKIYFWDADVYATTWNNEVCSTCRKPISGTAFKYTGRYLFFHSSCLNAPTNEKALLIHFGVPRHDRLILTEEVKNDGKEDVVCFGCEKPALGPGYKCSTSQCNILIHKSCFELPPQIQHPFHPNHALLLVTRQKKYCNACRRNCNAYPFYHCSECDFNLDIACATRSRININTDDCQHSFIPFLKQNQFTCEACGEEGQEVASLCSICQLLIHTKCAPFPRTIRITGHGHSLALTYSLRDQLKEHNNLFCNLCYQQVKTKYAAYYCQKCNYVAHLVCAFKFEESVHFTWLPKEFVDLATDDMEVKGAGKMQHFSHEHDLILSNEELVEDKLCDGCTGLISTPFYSCLQCSFFLHSKCAQLPREKRHLLHQHQLTLILRKSYSRLSCDACDSHIKGFFYVCTICDFFLDLQCCSIPKILKHEGHQHSLFLAVNSNRRCRVRNCTCNKKPGVFVCTNCDFALGFECATLPLVARYKYDDHLFRLTYSAEANCEEYYCLICEKERDPNLWFYYCAKCDFPVHPQCILGKKNPYIKFGSTFTSKAYHQHPLTVVLKTESSPPCNACGKTFEGMALECTQCKFNVHHSTLCLHEITNKATSK